jgi:hypothetical protein
MGIVGNVFLKTNPTTNNALFWQPEDKLAQMTLEANALSANIDEVTRERDMLLIQMNEQKKSLVEPTPAASMNVENPIPTQAPILNKKIKSIAHNLGGLMTGHSTYLYNKCLEYSLDPLMVAAIIKHESANGTSIDIRKQTNIAGFMGSRGLMYFKSIRDSIDFMVILLKKFYIDQGYNTLEKIQKKYCPIGAANDPTGLNKHWLPGVSNFYKIMVEESM